MDLRDRDSVGLYNKTSNIFFASQKGQWGYCDPDCVQLREKTEDSPPEPPVTDVIIQENNLPPLPTPTDPNNTCGSVVTFGSIVGGHDAKRGAYPFIAALGYKNRRNDKELPIIYACGGSLINRRYVVTAGANH